MGQDVKCEDSLLWYQSHSSVGSRPLAGINAIAVYLIRGAVRRPEAREGP